MFTDIYQKCTRSFYGYTILFMIKINFKKTLIRCDFYKQIDLKLYSSQYYTICKRTLILQYAGTLEW